MAEEAKKSAGERGEMSEEEMRERVIRLAFGGDVRLYEEFCEIVRAAIPEGTAVVLRGSAVTGKRWKDGAPFDADGPGTSDLDLTLVGDDILGHYILDGFYLPGVHTKPLSDKDPDIAPELVPLRERLMRMVKRPVNIQATRDFVMYIRENWFGQPYLTMIGKVGDS
jgi:predicted nucleotidyltransferase